VFHHLHCSRFHAARRQPVSPSNAEPCAQTGPRDVEGPRTRTLCLQNRHRKPFTPRHQPPPASRHTPRRHRTPPHGETTNTPRGTSQSARPHWSDRPSLTAVKRARSARRHVGNARPHDPRATPFIQPGSSAPSVSADQIHTYRRRAPPAIELQSGETAHGSGCLRRGPPAQPAAHFSGTACKFQMCTPSPLVVRGPHPRQTDDAHLPSFPQNHLLDRFPPVAA